MARFGDGLALDADLVAAAERATAQALEPLQGHAPDLLCIFVCGDDPDMIAIAGERAARRAGARTVIGCSATGVIGAGRGVEQTSAVSVWAGVLPDVSVRSFHLDTMRTPEGIGVAGLPDPEPDDVVAVLLADPYSFPADGFVQRASDLLGNLPIVGGMAAGPRGAGSTRLFLDGQSVERGAVGVLLGGPVGARPVVSQGCRPVGPTMVVTKAEGNVVLELASTPALSKIEQVVATLSPADQALVNSGLQIGIAMDEYADEHGTGDFLIRGILGADRERQSIVVGDLVDIGQTVRLQVRDADAADEELRSLLRTFRAGRDGDPVEGALLFSCNGRGAHLFTSADHDVTVVRRELATSGVAGFFAAGELGPVGGRNFLHGFTASILAFGSPVSGNAPGSLGSADQA